MLSAFYINVVDLEKAIMMLPELTITNLPPAIYSISQQLLASILKNKQYAIPLPFRGRNDRLDGGSNVRHHHPRRVRMRSRLSQAPEGSFDLHEHVEMGLPVRRSCIRRRSGKVRHEALRGQGDSSKNQVPNGDALSLQSKDKNQLEWA